MSDIKTVERRLPVGAEDFEKLVADLQEVYGDELPTKDVDTLKFVIASTIMHLGPLDSHKSLEFFYKTLVAGAAKQVSHHFFREVKLKQEAAIKAAEEAAKNSTDVQQEL